MKTQLRLRIRQAVHLTLSPHWSWFSGHAVAFLLVFFCLSTLELLLSSVLLFHLSDYLPVSAWMLTFWLKAALLLLCLSKVAKWTLFFFFTKEKIWWVDKRKKSGTPSKTYNEIWSISLLPHNVSMFWLLLQHYEAFLEPSCKRLQAKVICPAVAWMSLHGHFQINVFICAKEISKSNVAEFAEHIHVSWRITPFPMTYNSRETDRNK